jgi:intergrase/recombinase
MEEKYSILSVNGILENKNKSKWVNINVKLKDTEIGILNQRLKLLGFETLGQLTKGIVNGTFPHITEDSQIRNLSQNADSSGQKSVLEGGSNTDFYMKANTLDMHDYFLNVRKYHKNTVRDLISYFKRFREDFFAPNRVDTIRSLTPRVRSRIMDSMRKFGHYYLYKYNNEECIDLVEKIIRRHNLSSGMTEHGKLYIVDDNYLSERIRQLMLVDGEIGTIVKFGLFSGLREDEMVYVYNKPICSDLSGCSCNKLHIIEKPNGISIVLIQWHRGHKKCYFTIVPTDLFKAFKSLDSFEYRPHIRSAHEYMKVKTKDENITFMWLRKAHYNVMCRCMKPFEANILAGRAKSVDAKHYAMYELNEMTKKYSEAWQKFDVNSY